MRKCSVLSWLAAACLLTIIAPLAMAAWPPIALAGEPTGPAGPVPAAVEAAVTDTAPAAPDQIVVGAYINDIQELDFRTHSYAVDIYVWFRWKNKDLDPAKSLEFMNRYAPDDHVRTSLYDAPQPMPDGSLYSIVRNQGRFSTKFQLERFPFDTQSLRVELEDSTGGTAKQAYVLDTNALTINPAITLPGFKMGRPELILAENRYPTNFGDLTVEDAEAYSRASLVVPIMRPMTAISIKTFVPLLLITACALMVLFIRPMYVDGRIGLGITALLTLVALQLTSGASLPEVDYLMMIDKVYLASYAFIMLVLARVVATSWRVAQPDRERAVSAGDRGWSLVLCISYCVGLAIIGWTSLQS
jgi:hypothetical protein